MPAHLVFVTKFRHQVFTRVHLARLEEIMRDVCADFEAELTEFNGEGQHCTCSSASPRKWRSRNSSTPSKGYPAAG